MKKLLLILITIVITQGSCKKVDKLTHFKVDYSSDITINSSFYLNVPFDVWTPNIPTNYETTFDNNNTHTNLIEQIILTNMSMNITSSTSQTFDFLKSIEIYINADSLAEKKIAWTNDIPQTGLTTIALETISDDLQDYIKKNSYTLRSHTVTRQLLSDTTDIEIKSSFFADANILKI